MKSKIMILSLLFAGASATVNAQDTKDNYYTQKWTDNIYLGAGFGGMAVFNGGMNTPTFNFNVTIGKQITPVWGVRTQVGGLWQSLDEQYPQAYHSYCKDFVEFNLDGTMSLTNLFLGYNPDRALDLYAFAGPTMNIAKAVSANFELTGTNSPNSTTAIEGEYTYTEKGTKARFGATLGLGLAYNISNKWALNLEGRLGVTPSIFGYGSDCRSAEATGRLTLGFAYTFGGKKFAKVTTGRVIEKVIEKQIVKEVPVEVVKEVVKEVSGSGAAAIFFKIGKSVISPEGMVNVKLMAKVIKDSPNTKYKVAGFADKGTGSVQTNQTLSEKRAQAVYDALVAEGVNPNQLEKVAMGGTDPMFEKAYLNRVVILEVK